MRPRLSLTLLLSTLCFAAPAGAEWSTDGIPLCTAPRAQYGPVLVAGDSGSALAAWLDFRSGYNVDVYAQRVTPEGRLAPGWHPNGDSLSHITCMKYRAVAVTDGAGGAYVAWADNRCRDATGINIYIQRVTPSGAVAPGWPADGALVCGAPHDQQHPTLAADGSGGAIVAWIDQNDFATDVYAARILATGSPAPGWPEGGSRIAAATGDTAGPVVTTDGAGGAFVAWQAKRAATRDIYAQHVTGAGTLAPGWPGDGLVVSGAPGDQVDPLVTSDGAGGAFVLWSDTRAGSAAVYGQHLFASDSAVGWQANGAPISSGPGDRRARALVSDGTGGLFAAWEDGRAPATGSDIRVSRIDWTGGPAPGWPLGGSTACSAAGDQTSPALSADGAGGVFVAWTDARDLGVSGLGIYATHLAAGGVPATGWTQDGSPVVAAAGDQLDPRLCSDGAGGVFVAWIDQRADAVSGADVWIHRLAPDSPVPTQVRDLAASHRDGQTFLTWTCPPGLGWTYRVYASEAPITGASDLALATLVGSVGDSTWCDRRLSGLLNTTYAHRIDSLGAPLGPTQGLFVRTAPGSAPVWYAVTAQSGTHAEDHDAQAGVNATASAVAEVAAQPRPVWQRTVKNGYLTVHVYTLWTSRVDTPLFPAMATGDGQAYDCGIVRGGSPPSNALLVRCHWLSASFLNVSAGTGIAGEWVLSLDDPLLNWDVTSFWYGYHPGYDITSTKNMPPMSGVVQDYTLRRIVYTILWARRTFPVDTFRTYSLGYSMGGIGTNLLVFGRPDLFAAAMSVISHFDFSYATDPDTLNSFNTGKSLRGVADRELGTMASNLTCNDGRPVYGRLNLGFMASAIEPQAVPPLITMNGKRDVMVGWAEKLGFYQGMERARQGGTFFWDMREHTSPRAAWFPMQEGGYLYRFRSDRSFPALSNCSANHAPGDGTPASGDSVGTINGFVEWDTSLVDVPVRWVTTLRLRDLTTAWGPMRAPDSLTVDVTPRRLQNFRALPGHPCRFRVTRLGDGVVVQSGEVFPDSLERLTVVAVKVLRAGSRLELDYSGLLDAGPGRARGGLALALSRNPVAGRAELRLGWPDEGEGHVDLYDVSGRRVRGLWRGPASAGPARLAFETSDLPGGMYFVVARAAGTRLARRIVVLR